MESAYQRIKRQRNLIIVFFVVLIITFSILYFSYFKKEKPAKVPPPQVSFPERKIEIDFSIFENPILKELQPLEKIEPPSPEEIGRENPFSQIK
jgi:F0F1-type ATP synthase membrane subunit a